MMRNKECPNYNHNHPDATVRFCPMCGGVVNEKIPVETCTEKEHAAHRMERDKFCVNCGEQLINGNNGGSCSGIGR